MVVKCFWRQSPLHLSKHKQMELQLACGIVCLMSPGNVFMHIWHKLDACQARVRTQTSGSAPRRMTLSSQPSFWPVSFRRRGRVTLRQVSMPGSGPPPVMPFRVIDNGCTFTQRRHPMLPRCCFVPTYGWCRQADHGPVSHPCEMLRFYDGYRGLGRSVSYAIGPATS